MNKLEQDLKRLITKDPTVVNENANKDSATFSTMRDLTAGVVSKSYALNYLLPENVATAHKKGNTFSRFRLSSVSAINKLLFN